ncbi:MAG TPA: response regulator FixJ [Xanthobacteraceae bacterium]|nr:response regulator FixJ [Xanthobacteraceae bacterium]
MSNDQTVYVIDDDEAARDSLAFLFRTAEVDVHTYASAVEFLAAAPALKGGCVVTDVRMPQMDGLELLRRLRALDLALPVIVMTGHGDIPLAVEAMKAGAADFFEKPFSDDAMLAAVRRALGRQQQDRARAAERDAVKERLASLSARERQVLEGLVAGKANKVIAFDLGISARTVEIYRANVMTKMEAASLSELVRMALSAGLLGEATK